MKNRDAVVALGVALTLVGCVYPRRGTSLSPVRSERSTSSFDAPPHVYQLTIVNAQIRPRKSGDLAWDEGEGLPDAFVRLYRGEALIFETETLDDTLTPEWNAALPRNVRLPPSERIRIEVWDRDTVGSDPVGIYNGQGLPATALSDADSRIMLEGGSWLTIRANPPRPHRGLGIEEYEVRPDELRVLRVLPYSPAGRAGIEPGDRIVAIGDDRVSAMNDNQAASALSMAASRQSRLTVKDESGRERQVDLDRGFVWLTM
ncbi:MAG TPA: PDZ domain-containing protein [Candidatus Limnocylindrales bacterium]|nr:PDZ domain-containing protein [Candidatus Limnocylindrales bacterium]